MIQNKLFLSLILSLLLTPLVLAYNTQITVNSNYASLNSEVYKCTNSACSSITFYTSSVNGIYSIIGSGDNYYAAYDYKSCFKPWIHRIHLWGDYTGSSSYDVNFSQKQNCEEDIKTATLSENNIELGETVSITSKVHSGFEYPSTIPSTTAIPSNIKDEYSTNTRVGIYANGIKIGEEEAEILLASDKDFEFDWTPTSAGTYEIVAKSEVIDCACASQITQEFPIGTLVVNGLPECTVNSECGSESFSANYCKNSSVVRDHITPVCILGDCSSTNITETVQVCPNGCSNGNCIVTPVIKCNNNSECGTDRCTGENNFCSSNNVFQNFIVFTCHNPGTHESYCSNSTSPRLIQVCGISSCLGFGNNYCRSNSVYHSRLCFDRGCASGNCFSNSRSDEQLVQNCVDDCLNGNCIILDCHNNSECGSESFSANYCKNSSVVRDHITPVCILGDCSSTNITETVQVCPNGCSNGECIPNATVLSDFYIDNFYTEGTLYDNESASVRFLTHNLNGTNVTSVPVEIYLNNVLSSINSLPFPSQNFDWGIGFGVLESGFYNLTIKVDPQNVYPELNESNNLATFFFSVFSQDTCLTVPSTVSNLHVSSKSTSHILWSWTNPSGLDFNGTIIFLEGVMVASLDKNQSSYNALNLDDNTEYTLVVHTKNICGNVNNTDVVSTASTNKEKSEGCHSCGKSIIVLENETTDEEPIRRIIPGTTEGPALITNKKPQANPYLALWIIFLLLVFLLLVIMLIAVFRRRR